LETLEYWVVRNGSMRYSDKLFDKVMEAEYEISLGIPYFVQYYEDLDLYRRKIEGENYYLYFSIQYYQGEEVIYISHFRSGWQKPLTTNS
jgi:plasmid stabilization system protein, relE/parE family